MGDEEAGFWGGLVKGAGELWDDVVLDEDSALWDAATGAAVGAGVAWATDNDIALGAGIGAGAGYLTSTGGYFDSLPAKFDLTDLLFGKSGEPLGVNSLGLDSGVEGSLQKTNSLGTAGTKGLLDSKIGLSLLQGGAQAYSQQQQLDQLLEDRKKDRAANTVNSSGNFSGLPSSMKRTGSFLGSRG